MVRPQLLTVVFVFLCALFSRPTFSDQSHVGLYRNDLGVPIVQLIQSAEKKIQIEIYDMNDDQVLGALSAAMKRGVRLEIVQEPTPVGSRCKIFAQAVMSDDTICQKKKKFRDEVVAHGGRYVPYNKVELCSAAPCFQHGKILIVDGKTALVSTGNFNHTSFCHLEQNPAKCNRDYTVILNDPRVVSTLVWVIEKDLLGKKYDLSGIPKSKVGRLLTVSPFSYPPILDFIASAKKSIYLQNQYFNDALMNQALAEAAKRGVKVFISASSPCSYGEPSDLEKKKFSRLYSEFEKAGVQSRFFTYKIQVGKRPGYLHAKAIVVDEQYAWVGSVNGSTTAFSYNREFGVFFANSSWVKNLGKQIEEDYSSQGSEPWKDAAQCREYPAEVIER